MISYPNILTNPRNTKPFTCGKLPTVLAVVTTLSAISLHGASEAELISGSYQITLDSTRNDSTLYRDNYTGTGSVNILNCDELNTDDGLRISIGTTIKINTWPSVNQRDILLQCGGAKIKLTRASPDPSLIEVYYASDQEDWSAANYTLKGRSESIRYPSISLNFVIDKEGRIFGVFIGTRFHRFTNATSAGSYRISLESSSQIDFDIIPNHDE